jgi:peptide/nickel transport system permease protein
MVIFSILALAPGDPLSDLALYPSVPPEVRQRIRENMGLEDPIPVQYGKWAKSLFTGDFGYSYRTRAPVIDLIKQRLPTTLYVSGLAFLFSILIAVPIGVLSAVKQYSVFDNVATTIAFIGFSLPTFCTGLLFILLFTIKLDWLPSIYRSTVEGDGLGLLWARTRQAIMPVTVLGLFQAATLIRFVRASMLENIHQDYVRTARAKGLAERVLIVRHVLRNALIPVITIIGLQAGTLLGGVVVIEQLFGLPGLGWTLLNGIYQRDYPVVQGTVLFFALVFALTNLLVDLTYAQLDPRIKYG